MKENTIFGHLAYTRVELRIATARSYFTKCSQINMKL